jgi:hypothetical protein
MALDSLHFNSLMATPIKFETKTYNLVFALMMPAKLLILALEHGFGELMN